MTVWRTVGNTITAQSILEAARAQWASTRYNVRSLHDPFDDPAIVALVEMLLRVISDVVADSKPKPIAEMSKDEIIAAAEWLMEEASKR